MKLNFHSIDKGKKYTLFRVLLTPRLIALVFLFSFNSTFAHTELEPSKKTQSSTIKGKVVDGKTGEALAGANVVLVGGSQGTTTDFDGNYTLALSEAASTVELEASYIGYGAQRLSVSLSSSETTLNFSLQPSAQQLGAVVVTANKRGERLQDVPSSVQAITSETVEQIGIRDINEVIAFVPGASEDLSFGAGLRQYQLRGIPTGTR